MSTGAEPFMRLRGIGKRYGPTSVLRDVDLDLRHGRCIALVGENGAGKSTLVGIVSGAVSPSEGRVAIEGQPVVLRSPRDGRDHGIVVVPQELSYVPELSVAENVMLANWPRARLVASQRFMRRRCREIFRDLSIDVDVRRTMVELPLADRQLVEIAKALASEARLLVFDEPTAALHAGETAALLDRLRELKARGVGLVYVSHHLDECFAVADELLVLRNGAVVQHSAIAETSRSEVTAAMLGRDYVEPSSRSPAAGSLPQALGVSGWSRERQPALRDLSFAIREGEVLGIFGLVGSGAESVARGLGGHEPGIRGTVVTGSGSEPVPRTPRHARRLSIAYVPAERKTDGLALSQSVGEHLTIMVMARVARLGWVRRRAQQRVARELVERFDVRCRGLSQTAEQLSGGNQQKLLLASRIVAAPRILVLHEPTRGVDIGSRAQIHETLVKYARDGAAVVLTTSDVQEAAAADRLLILRDGRLVAELVGDEKTEQNALSIATAGAGRG